VLGYSDGVAIHVVYAKDEEKYVFIITAITNYDNGTPIFNRRW